MAPITPPSRGTQPIPVNDERKARSAWEAYAAMRQAETNNPKLRDNDLWRTLRDDAYGEFRSAFEALL